jgi:elongation factor P
LFSLKGCFVIFPSDFKKGSTKILWNNEPWLVIDYLLVQPGKGGTYMRTKLKNLITGRILEETFRSGEKLTEPDLEKVEVKFLYKDGGMHHFMNQEDFDQIEFGEQQVSNVKNYLKEEVVYEVLYFNGKSISIDPPMFVNLKIIETVPGVKGDTAQGGSKHATLETGLVLSVPLFLNEGDLVKVDTRSGKYLERVVS